MADEQVLLDGFEIEICRVMLRPIRRDDEQLGAGAATRESGDEFESGLMRPLDIFDDEDEEFLSREIFESFAKFAGTILEGVQARSSGCGLLVLIGRSDAVSECFDNCVIGLFLAQPFDAMSVSHARLRCVAKSVDQGSLPDAGFSSDEDNLALTGCSLERDGLQAEDFIIAAD